MKQALQKLTVNAKFSNDKNRSPTTMPVPECLKEKDTDSENLKANKREILKIMRKLEKDGKLLNSSNASSLPVSTATPLSAEPTNKPKSPFSDEDTYVHPAQNSPWKQKFTIIDQIETTTTTTNVTSETAGTATNIVPKPESPEKDQIEVKIQIEGPESPNNATKLKENDKDKERTTESLYKVKEISTSKYKAIKTIEISLENQNLASFLNEILTISRINHDNLHKIEKIFFEFNERSADEDELHQNFFKICIVMPWMQQNFLHWLLKIDPKDSLTPVSPGESSGPHKTQSKTTFLDIPNNKRTFGEVRFALFSILEAINILHANNIIHMGVKCENILVAEEENLITIPFVTSPGEIVNFVLAHSFVKKGNILKTQQLQMKKDSKSRKTAISKLMREQTILAPEVLEFLTNSNKKANFTAKVDIYGFGAMLFRIFIHQSNPEIEISTETIKKRIAQLFPNEKDNISDDIIEDLELILEKTLERDEKARPFAIELLQDHEFFNYFIKKGTGHTKNSWGTTDLIMGLSNLSNEQKKQLLYPKEVQNLINSAEKEGNIKAMFELGHIFEMGRDVQKGFQVILLFNLGKKFLTFFPKNKT